MKIAYDLKELALSCGISMTGEHKRAPKSTLMERFVPTTQYVIYLGKSASYSSTTSFSTTRDIIQVGHTIHMIPGCSKLKTELWENVIGSRCLVSYSS